MIQEKLHLVVISPLKGEYENPPMPEWNASTWLNKQYQDSLEKYIQLNFGFSPLITKLHNQYVFELYHISRSPSVVIGKKNEIYDYGQIQSYLGNNYIGEQAIQNKIAMLEALQEVLTLYNTQLVLVIAPSKPSFAPEFLPDTYTKTTSISNYDYYSLVLSKSKLPFVDLSVVFKEWKNHQPYPLYPQCGVHWSEYGATLAADTMLHFLRTITVKNIPDMSIDSLVISDSLSASDYDMGSILNLLYPIKPYRMAYPIISVQQKDESNNPSVLAVADSYYWIWYNIVGFDRHYFGRNVFMEYFSKAHSKDFATKDVFTMDVIKETVQSDLVIIMCSESNLYRLGFGYVEEMYRLIPEMKKQYHEKVALLKSQIKNDPEWMKTIEQKAMIRHIPTDSMLTLDAIYVLQNNKSQ